MPFKKLRQVAQVLMGTSPKGHTYNSVGEGLPLLNGPTEFGERHPACTSFTSASVKECEAGDLIFCVRGSTTGRMNWADKVYSIGRGVCAIRGEQELDTKFIRYCLDYRLPALLQLAGGATFPNLPQDTIKDFDIPYPPNRREIAATLFAYDDSIENNRRRMELLEQSARLLYQEWFVRFRFPGHKHTHISKGIPQGWERKPLAELCQSIDYGYTASADWEVDGPKFLRITDIVPDHIDWPAVPQCPIEDDRLEKFRLREGDIVIARTGATVGYAKRLHKRHPEAVFASYLVRLRLKPEVNNLMVGIFVESAEYKSYIQSRVGGAAQPNANAKVLAGAEILVPTPRIQHEFHEFAEPLIDQREVLQIQNQKLRAARDLLLPRLMSGEIAI